MSAKEKNQERFEFGKEKVLRYPGVYVCMCGSTLNELHASPTEMWTEGTMATTRKRKRERMEWNGNTSRKENGRMNDE